MDSMLQEIGERIKLARQNKQMSQMDLAEATGLSVSFISNVEMGKQSMNIRALIAISNALEVSADWLLRNNTQEAMAITSEEIAKELQDCTPIERDAILHMVQAMKGTLRKMQENQGE